MTQKELHNSLGELYKTLEENVKNGKYSEKSIITAKTMTGVAKQMGNSADIILRASKLLGNYKVMKDVIIGD